MCSGATPLSPIFLRHCALHPVEERRKEPTNIHPLSLSSSTGLDWRPSGLWHLTTTCCTFELILLNSYYWVHTIEFILVSSWTDLGNRRWDFLFALMIHRHASLIRYERSVGDKQNTNKPTESMQLSFLKTSPCAGLTNLWTPGTGLPRLWILESKVINAGWKWFRL